MPTRKLPKSKRKNFRQLFLEHPNVLCRTEKLVEEDLYEDRYDKWYVVADALRAELVTRRGLDARQIRLFIDVMDNDFEDRVYITYLYKPKEDAERGVLLHTACAQLGQRFETVAQFEEYLWREYRRLEEGYDLVAPPEPSAESQKQLFLARFEVRCGEHFFPFHHTIEAEDIEAARARARRHVQAFHLSEAEPDEDWFVFLGGEVAVRCTSVEETTPERLATRRPTP